MSEAREYLRRYVEMAERTDEEGMTWESALSIERSGKYVEILFCTGGPHFDVLLEFPDDEAGEFFFESEPVGGIAHYGNWFESDYCGISAHDANSLLLGVLRDPDELVHPHDFECEDGDGSDSDVCDSCGEFRDNYDEHPAEEPAEAHETDDPQPTDGGRE
jgi:hypothetical protein